MEAPFFHEIQRQASSYLTGKISRGRTHPSIHSPSYFCIPTPPPSPTPSHTHSHELVDNNTHTPEISSERRSMIKQSAREQMREPSEEECELLQTKNLEILVHSILATYTLMCSHPRFRRYYSYYELPSHELACPHDTCECTEPCYNYTGLRADLMVHLAEDHLIIVIRISYNHAQFIQEKVPFPDSAHRRLICKGRDGSVFILTITTGVPGTKAGPTIVCASAWPLYTMRMWAHAQPPLFDTMHVIAEAPSYPMPREV